MSLSVNGQSCVPPGFRFHPTEEELLHYYLRKKVANEKIDLDVIREIDLNKLEPWDIQEKCRIGSTPQNDWYFFSHKDKKYPTGTRTNRATAAGFWKATGRDKVIYTSFKRIGMRKTLVFYKGRAPHGQKSDWIMHEYRLDDYPDSTNSQFNSTSSGETTQEEGWVICRVFKKKNHNKTLDSQNDSTITGVSAAKLLHSRDDGALDQILQYMGRTCKQEPEKTNITMRFLTPLETSSINRVNERFMQLPQLESSTLPEFSNDCRRVGRRNGYSPVDLQQQQQQQQQQAIAHIETSSTNRECANLNAGYASEPGLNDWATLDRLVASHLNGQEETSKQLACFNDPSLALTASQPFATYCSATDHELQLPSHRPTNNKLFNNNAQDYNCDIDLWSLIRSSSPSSDPLTCSLHVSSSGFVSTTPV